MAEETPDPKSEQFSMMEFGLSGLNRQGGFVYEEFLKELQGPRGIQIYKEMRDNDSTIGAMLFAIEMLIRKCEWNVDPVSDSPEDTAAAEFLEENMCDMEHTWDEFITEALSMLVFGFSYHEIVYKKRVGPKEKEGMFQSKYSDGRIGWRKLGIRSQETLWQWRWDDNGKLLGMIQQSPPDYRFRFIPIEKALLFRPKTHKNNPEGRSILRTAYRDWYFKKHIENVEGIGIERDLAGLPVALVPPELLKSNCTPEQKATLAAIEQMVKNVRRDEQEGIVFPKAFDEAGRELFEFKLLSSGGSRQLDTDKVVERKSRGIAGSVLADFILLGQQQVGSFALSSDKREMFAQAIMSWTNAIADILNDVAIPKLFALNTFNITEFPRFKPSKIETFDLNEMGTFINRLSLSGMQIFPNLEIENFLLRQSGLPEKDEDDHAQEIAGAMQGQRDQINDLKAQVAAGNMQPDMAKAFAKQMLKFDDETVAKIFS